MGVKSTYMHFKHYYKWWFLGFEAHIFRFHPRKQNEMTMILIRFCSQSLMGAGGLLTDGPYFLSTSMKQKKTCAMKLRDKNPYFTTEMPVFSCLLFAP